MNFCKPIMTESAIKSLLTLAKQELESKQDEKEIQKVPEETEATKDLWFEGEKFVVEFRDENGNLIETKEVTYKDHAEPPTTIPQKPSTEEYDYEFVGWEGIDDVVKESTSYRPVYKEVPRYASVIFYNGDGSVFSNQNIRIGQTCSVPSTNPTKAHTDEWDYVFQNWDKDTSQPITAPIEFHPIFQSISRYRTVRFLNENGSVLKSEQVLLGHSATPPANPSKASTAQYNYSFAGWTNGYTNITGNVDTTAKFTASVRRYTVTIKNGSTTVSTQAIEYGKYATIPSTGKAAEVGTFTYNYEITSGSLGPISANTTVNVRIERVAIASEISKWSYSLSGGNVILTKYNGSDANVVVSDKYIISGNKYRTKFVNCTSMFGQPNGSSTFNTTIKTITFGSYIDSSQMNNMSCMFLRIQNMTTISGLQYLNTANVTSMHDTFARCYALTSLTGIENWNVQRVTDLEGTFFGLQVLKSLNLSGWDLRSGQNYTKMFKDCKELTSLSLTPSKFVQAAATNLYHMFETVPKLTSVPVAGFNTVNVTNMSGLFAFSTGITSLDLRSWDIRKCDNVSAIFKNMSACTVIYVKSGLWSYKSGCNQGSGTSGMFYGCRISSVTYA